MESAARGHHLAEAGRSPPMRSLLLILFSLLLLAACAPQERIYEAWEVDEPPVMVGDSLVIEAPAPLPPPERGEH